MTWTGQSFSVGQILTAAQMTNLQADISAVANGDSGAPKLQSAAYGVGTVDQTAIGASVVGQGELKVSSQSVSVDLTVRPYEFTFSGGAYAMGHTCYIAATLTSVTLNRKSTSTSSLARWELDVAGASGVGYATLYYINASPPYDLGDGEIPLFIYVNLDKSGNIIAISSSTEAPWHYNGPTNLAPCRYDREGRAYRRIKDMSKMPSSLMASFNSGDAGAIAEYQRAFISAEWIEQELTQDIKNADMNLIPSALNGTEGSIVLLDPVSELTWELFEMQNHGQFNINEFISKWCKIDSEPLPRKGPVNIPIVGYAKRNTPT